HQFIGHTKRTLEILQARGTLLKQSSTIYHDNTCTSIGLRKTIRAQLHDDLFGDSTTRRARTNKHDTLVPQLFTLGKAGGQQSSQRNGSRSLDIIIEATHFIPITTQ